MILNDLNPEYHNGKSFREQIAVLYVGSCDQDDIYLLRSYMNVCLPGCASFDSDKPGSDTEASWNKIDYMIEKEGVRGVFHTHPPGVHDYSGQDWSAMRAFAMANGDRWLWYGVQACDHNEAHFVALTMKDHKIFCYDGGWFEHQVTDRVIALPLPPRIDVAERMYIVY